jgi:predicted DCC family thiol-disulfide oxidoreductase YuxK
MAELTTFYDGGCPLCSREIAHYRRIDRAGRIRWIDITQDAEALALAGLDVPTAMRRLHVQEGDGQTLSGIDAFLAIWQHLPRWHLLARLVRALRLRGPLEWGYRRFAERACAID